MPRSASGAGRGTRACTAVSPDKGVTLLIELEAIGEADERGIRNVMGLTAD